MRHQNCHFRLEIPQGSWVVVCCCVGEQFWWVRASKPDISGRDAVLNCDRATIAANYIGDITDRGLVASDPRDRIFGLLGIAQDVNTLSISADYRKLWYRRRSHLHELPTETEETDDPFYEIP